MSVSEAFRRLATVVDGIETDDVEVCDAAIPADRSAISDGKVHVTLDLAIAFDEPMGTDEAESDEHTGNGRDSTDRAVISDVLSESTDAGQAADPDEAQRRTNGEETTEEESMDGDTEDAEARRVEVDTPEASAEVVCPEPGCDETFESEPGMKIHRTKIHLRGQDADGSSDTTPAYRDPDALQAAYEAHDSFPAMREALDVDVSAQTVRRHMIQHGIHDPTDTDDADTDDADDSRTQEQAAEEADDTDVDTEKGEPADSEARAETEPAQPEAEPEEEAEETPLIPEDSPLAETLPSEVTAPADVTFAELREAVRTADTLYDIQQQFDLDRMEARDLLDHLDLLELVHGRVATKREREELKAEIDSRIHHSISGTGTSA